MTFVDLAGSERLNQSGSEHEHKKETMAINKSLFQLGTVIKALSSKQAYIPYRDSKLTQLLKDSLGGTAKALMVACITPSVQFAPISLSTLTYAQAVQSIKNTPVVRRGDQQVERERLLEEIRMLKNRIVELERTKAQVEPAAAKAAAAVAARQGGGRKTGSTAEIGRESGGSSSYRTISQRSSRGQHASASPAGGSGSGGGGGGGGGGSGGAGGAGGPGGAQRLTPLNKGGANGNGQGSPTRQTAEQRAVHEQLMQIQAENEQLRAALAEQASKNAEVAGMLRSGYGTPLGSRGSMVSNQGGPADFPQSVTEDYLDEVDDPNVLRAIALRLKIESNTAITSVQQLREQIQQYESQLRLTARLLLFF